MSTILFKACRKRTEHREYVPFSMRLSRRRAGRLNINRTFTSGIVLSSIASSYFSYPCRTKS